MQPPSAPPLLGVAALQLETRPMATAQNLVHIEALLASECRRLGVRRWDCDVGGGGDSRQSGEVHLDILVLPEVFNAGYLMNEAAWYYAEGLTDPCRSPSLAALSCWAARYRCYVAATLLEATPDGHIYNSLVLAAPDGSFVTHPGGGGCGRGSVALVRKHRASSLEGFVFRSAGPPGRGGEPAAHVVEVDATPLLAKRSGSSTSGGGGSSSGVGSAAECAEGKLRLAFSICYENMCYPTMAAILAEHRREPLDLLISPFCAMAPAHDHPTFKWPKQAAQRFAAAAEAVSSMHAAKLGVHTVACHRTGAWSSPLPRLLPLLRRDPVAITGPMLGCSAIYAPGGLPLLQMEREGLALAHLPLLQRPRPHPGAAAAAAAAGASAADSGSDSQLGSVGLAGEPASALAGLLGAAAVESAHGAPAAPYARYWGGFVVEPVCWQVRLGFPLMEALGSLSYHCWLAPLRRRVACTIAAEGVWRGPVPPLEAGGLGRRAAALAVAAAAGAALASALALRSRQA